jgi:hypothetical protein
MAKRSRMAFVKNIMRKSKNLSVPLLLADGQWKHYPGAHLKLRRQTATGKRQSLRPVFGSCLLWVLRSSGKIMRVDTLGKCLLAAKEVK